MFATVGGRRVRRWFTAAGLGVLAVAGTVATLLVMAVVLVVVYFSWPESHAHLDALTSDPIPHCSISETLVSRFSASGTKRGVGFGGTSPTEVGLDYRLDSDPTAASDAVQNCATAAGWVVSRQSRPIDIAPSLLGTKTFSGGQQAPLFVDYVRKGGSGERLLTILAESDAG